MALPAVCKIHSWVRGSSTGQSEKGKGRQGIMPMPDHQLFPTCWPALEKSLEVELGRWNALTWPKGETELEFWRGEIWAEVSYSGLVWFGRKPKDYLVLTSLPWAGNLPLPQSYTEHYLASSWTPPTSLGNLLQCITTLTANFLLISSVKLSSFRLSFFYDYLVSQREMFWNAVPGQQQGIFWGPDPSRSMHSSCHT